MIRRFAPFAFAVLLAGAAHGQALYVPPQGDFTVAFAAAPKVDEQPAKRSHDIGRRRYVDQEASHLLIVDIDEYPDGALPQLVDGGVYDRLLRDHAESSQMELVSTRAARLSGRPCLEGTFHNGDGYIEVVRVLMIGDRIWRLTFATVDGVPDQSGPAAAFFSSFKITR